MGRNKVSNSIHPSKPIAKPKYTPTTCRKSKPNKLKALGVIGTKKLIQDMGVDLVQDYYIYHSICDRHWDTCINSIGIVNESLIRELYFEYKKSSTFENALVSVKRKTFRISSDSINMFLGISRSTNASELNKEKIKTVFALVTNKPLNLGDLLIEHIECEASSSRLDKKLAFQRFLTHFCMKQGVLMLEDNVLPQPLEKFCDKRLVFMSYKDKGKASDTFRIFGEHHEPCVVTSTNPLPEWAMQFQERLMSKIGELDANVVELNAKDLWIINASRKIGQHSSKVVATRGTKLSCFAKENLRDERDFGPAHFVLKIESYSLLSNAPFGHGKRYESGIFDVEGYKWKLILYPHGDKTCEGKGSISLNVAIDEKAKGALKHFDNLRTEHGCAQLISLDELNDPSKGYLVNDCYVFGVEVFVIQPSSGNEETLTMVKEPSGGTYTWSIKNFSKLNDNLQYSNEFTVGGRKWNLKLFPKGIKSDMGKSLSLYLWLSDWKSVIPERKVYVEYKLRVVDQSRVEKVEKQVSHWFDSNKDCGFSDFISIKELLECGKGYLNDDTLIVEVEFIVISITKVRP
ncbi:hypothetical protein Dsin_013236 [Dipteronia sinensis]|uniref:MATH domain-containing protein n=1 Tax=Dipteronia sinensis TaxID=43782 RepID=A0AAE0AJJ5_9ROSI|nr:hypothetical protein Dsin_013236 [Dipteronia sinensis]